MYLPSFPAIADHLDARASLVQLSLTSCLLGLAVGQIVIGPISDAKGRKGPLLISISLFMLSSLLCALAPTITALVIARFCRGLRLRQELFFLAPLSETFLAEENLRSFCSVNGYQCLCTNDSTDGRRCYFTSSFCKLAYYFLVLSLIGLLIVLTISMRLKKLCPLKIEHQVQLVILFAQWAVYYKTVLLLGMP